MSNIERYGALLRAALEAQQLKIELERKLVEVGKNISANELKHRRFDDDDARKAIAILSEDILTIEESDFVKAQAVYKDVKVSLHCDPSSSGAEAMKHILESLRSKEIFDA